MMPGMTPETAEAAAPAPVPLAQAFRQAPDSVNPAAIPASAPLVFGYGNGAVSRWRIRDWWKFPASGRVVIDVDGSLWDDSDEADVEAGDLDIAGAVEWIRKRGQFHSWWGSLYCNYKNTYPQLRAAIDAAGFAQHTGYHIADWNLTLAEAEQLLGGGIWAVQYESASQTGKGYDLSVVHAVHPFPAPVLLEGIQVAARFSDGTVKNWSA
jgi:hypothetical protein